MSNTSSAIADLQARWHTLQDLDRAKAVLPLLRAGVSRRFLATTLNCSESTLRHLLNALQADQEDQQLFRSGSISRNELVRRSRSSHAHREVRLQERAEQARRESVTTGCRTILNWLAQDESRAFNAEQIAEEAKFRLIWSPPGSGTTATQPAKDVSIDELIASCRPDPHPDELDVNWNVRWLLSWLSRTIPDAGIRLDAVDQAHKQVSSPHWTRNL